MSGMCLAMKVETTIKKIGDRLGIIIPRSVITNANLQKGDVLKIHIQGKNMLFSLDNNESNIIDPVVIHQRNDDIYSRILKENQLVLAK